MEELSENTENQNEDKPKKSRLGRLALWFLIISLSTIVLFQLVFLFYADQMFGRVLKEVVFQNSKGVYSVEYEKVRFNVFKNEIEFSGLEVKSDSMRFFELESQAGRSNRLLDFSSPHISIQGPSLLKLYFDKVLTINEFDIEDPLMKMRIYGEVRKGKVGLRNFHELLSEHVSFLQIESFNITNGELQVSAIKNNARKGYSVSQISTAVDGFVLNKNANKDSLLALRNLSIELGSNTLKIDTINRVLFDKMTFSTKDSIVSFRNFSLTPKQWVDTKNQPEFSFKSFDLQGVDFSKMYFNNNFDARIIVADSGKAHYRVITKPDSLLAWANIDKAFDTISVDQIVILNTNLFYEKKIGKRQPSLNLPINKIIFKDLLIDSNSFFNNKKSFYSKNVDLVLNEFDLYSKDSSQVITTKSFSLSTLRREMLLFDVSITSLGNNTAKARIDGNLRSIQFFGLDPLIALQDNEVIARAVLLESPNILLKQGTATGQKFSNDVLNKLVKQQFKRVHITNVEIENANVEYINRSGTQTANVQNAQVYCNNFKTHKGAVPRQNYLISDWFSAEGASGFLKLSDNVHTASVTNFKVFSQDGGFYTDRLKIAGERLKNDSTNIDNTIIEDANFYNLSIDGLNVDKLAYSNEIELTYLESKGANNLVMSIGERNNPENALAKIDIKELNIDSLNTEIISYSAENGETLIKSSGLLLQTCDLKWDSSYAKGLFDLYSIQLEGNDVWFSNDNGKHALTSKKLKLNSSYELFQVTGFKVQPFEDKYVGKEALWFQSPSSRISGLNIPLFFKTRRLEADNIYSSKPQIAFHGIAKDENGLADFLTKPFSKTENIFNTLNVKTLRVHDGKVHYTNHFEDKEISYDLDNLLLYFEDLVIDSFSTQTDSNIFLAKKSEIEFQNFEQRANDTSMILLIGKSKLHPHNKKVWVEDLELRNRKPAGSLGYFSIKSDLATLSNFNYGDFLINKTISMQKAEFTDPSLSVGLKKKSASNQQFFERDIPKALTKNYASIYTDSLVLKDAMFKVNYRDKNSNEIATEKVDGWNVLFQVFNVDRNYQNLNFLYSRAISADLEHYKRRLADSLNVLKVGRLNVNVNRGRIYMDSVELMPRYSKELYAATYGKQIDRIEVFNQNSSIENFKFKDWLYNGNYRADELRLNRTVISVFTDKTLDEEKAKIKKMPQVVIRELPMNIRIDTTFINNWSISYEEKVSDALDPGIIYFKEFGGTIANVSNWNPYGEDSVVRVNIKTGLMENGKVNVKMEIPLDHEDDEFSFSGDMNGMDMREINPLLMTLTQIEITQGETYGMQFDGKANKYFATGEVDLRYSNLKVNIIDGEEPKSNILKGAIKFLANNFIIKSSNRLFPKKGKIDFVRDEHKSIFNYGAKALLTGIKESIGLKNKDGVQNMEFETNPDGGLEQISDEDK